MTVPWGPAPQPDTNLLGPRALQYGIDVLVQTLASTVPTAAVVGLLVAAGVKWGWVAFGVSALAYTVFNYAAWFVDQVLWARRRGGQTFGMQVVGLRIVDRADLGPVGTGRLALRWVVLMFIDTQYYLAAILIGVTQHHQRLGDMAANTLVVREDDPVVAAVRAGELPVVGAAPPTSRPPPDRPEPPPA